MVLSLSCFKQHIFFHKKHGVMDVIWGLTHQRIQDVGDMLNNVILSLYY